MTEEREERVLEKVEPVFVEGWEAAGRLLGVVFLGSCVGLSERERERSLEKRGERKVEREGEGGLPDEELRSLVAAEIISRRCS